MTTEFYLDEKVFNAYFPLACHMTSFCISDPANYATGLVGVCFNALKHLSRFQGVVLNGPNPASIAELGAFSYGVMDVLRGIKKPLGQSIVLDDVYARNRFIASFLLAEVLETMPSTDTAFIGSELRELVREDGWKVHELEAKLVGMAGKFGTDAIVPGESFNEFMSNSTELKLR